MRKSFKRMWKRPMLPTVRASLEKKLPTLVLAILVIQPPLDVVSYFLQELGNNLFSTVLRFFMLAAVGLLGFVLTKRKKAYLVIYSVMAVFWILHAANGFRIGYISLYQDTANYLRILTLPVFLLSFMTFFSQGGEAIRRRIGLGFAINAGLSVLFTALPWGLAALGVGEPVYTYDKLFLGVMGWFAIPNAQSCVIVLFTPLTLLFAGRTGKLWPFLLACGACFGLMFVTGTKLTFYCLFLIPMAFLALGLISKNRKKLLPLGAVLVGVMVLTAVCRNASPMQIRENMSNYSQNIYSSRVKESLEKTGASKEVMDTIREGTVEKKEEEKDGKGQQKKEAYQLLAEVRRSLWGVYTDPDVYGAVLEDLNNRFGVYNVMSVYHYSANSASLSDLRLRKTNYARLVWEECDLPTKLLGFEYSQVLYNGNVYDLENDFPAVYYNCGWLGFALYLSLFTYLAFVVLRAFFQSIQGFGEQAGQKFTNPLLKWLYAFWLGLQDFLSPELGAVGITLVLALGAAQISGYVLRRPNVAIYLAVAMAYLHYLTVEFKKPPARSKVRGPAV